MLSVVGVVNGRGCKQSLVSDERQGKYIFDDERC